MTTYLITGANRGIGLEFARQLSKRGAETTILATAREPDKATDLARLVHEVLPLDVADEPSLAKLPALLKDRPIDVLINNAGVTGKAKSIADLQLADLQRVFAVDAFGAMLVSKAVLPNLRKGAAKKVFNITSQLGSIKNNTGGSTYEYRASKAALNQLTVCMANELRADGFTCVVVHPGWVQTDMGGKNATLKPEESVAAMLKLLDALKPDDTGKFLNYDGSTLPW
jgi:NAD(P)-dependent dehydrogenase (short-subunit alcohol dehydrogenase family)